MRRATGVLGIAIAIASMTVWFASSPHLAMARARVAADDPHRFAARISAAHAATEVMARLLPREDPLVAAERLDELAGHATDDAAARMRGLAYFVAGDGDKAAISFESIRLKSAQDWNDLAAAHISRKTGDPDRWTDALVAADRSLATDGHRREAIYNRALVLDHFGLGKVLTVSWPQDDDPRWAAAARQHAAAAARDVSPKLTKEIATAPLEQLPALTRRAPSDTRSVAETIFLAHWADAKTDAEAKEHLDRARVIGEILRHEFGEALLADSVAAIDRGGPSIESLRRGHSAYRAGRETLETVKDEGATGGRMLLDAERQLAAGGSPMAALAAEYAATAYTRQTRTADAHALLMRVREVVEAHPEYQALRARSSHDLALYEAQRGHWSASIDAATETHRIWTRFANRADAAAAAAIIAENYDYLGQRELAWRYATAALRDACTAKHAGNARRSLIPMTHAEMRAGHWDAARSIARLEEALIPQTRDARRAAGLLFRIAVIESHCRNWRAAEAALHAARANATANPSADVRAKLLADVDGAAGAILRERDPRRAAALLSSAIAYQKSAARALFLPELYLERGRASLALREWDKAERDFESGIAELERQRDHVDDAEARPGLFDSSAALFEEATALQVRRGAEPGGVLATIERGRARAMLEQLGAAGERASLKDVQGALGDGAILIEYFALPQRLVIVAVTRRDARVVTVDVTRDALATADRMRLYDILIRPVLRDERAITVVVDDALQRMAFSALVDRSTNEFLVEKHTVAMEASAGVALIALKKEPTPKPESVLVFANPDIPRDKYPNLRSLNSSEKEAAWVARRYPGAELFKRDEATAERFLAMAPQFDSVHFAGHANVEKAEPGASALVCASSPRVHGALTLRQIAAMRFTKTRVVVLAACSTMDGRNAAIEGVPSLARAFVIAGVPAVVGTLWDIDDANAAPIMRVLHEKLAKGTEPADALRAAQLAAIREGRPVKEWAAFAVTGVAR